MFLIVSPVKECLGIHISSSNPPMGHSICQDLSLERVSTGS